MRFARIAFLDRLRQYRHKHLLLQPFNALVGNCKTLRMQKMLLTYTTMTVKSQVLRTWHKLFAMRTRERNALRMIISMVYHSNVRRMFLTWRIRASPYDTLTKCSLYDKLAKTSIQSHVMLKWKRAVAARRKWRLSLLGRVMAAWMEYFKSIDVELLRSLRLRRRMWSIIIRFGRDLVE